MRKYTIVITVLLFTSIGFSHIQTANASRVSMTPIHIQNSVVDLFEPVTTETLIENSIVNLYNGLKIYDPGNLTIINSTIFFE